MLSTARPRRHAAWPADPTPPPKQRFSAEWLVRGIRRRLENVWSYLTRGERTPPAEAAFDWLMRHGGDEGVPPVGGSPYACPGVTGGAIETAVRVTAPEAAARWAKWLLIRQATDGSWPDASLLSPSLSNTGHAVRGLLAVEPAMPEAKPAVLAACRYLCSRVDDVGKNLPEPGHAVVSCLPPLLRAGRRFEEVNWEAAARRGFARCLPGDGSILAGLPSHVLAWWVETLIDLDYDEAAANIMRQVANRQRRDGSVRDAGKVSTEGMAHLAVCWYRLGRRESADRAMQYLFRRFPRKRETGWAVKFYLDAALLEVRAAFDALSRQPEAPLPEPAADLPDTIDQADGRVQEVREWCSTLPPDGRVADVGCGKGRFLKHLTAWFPAMEFTAIDPSEAMLTQAPPAAARLRGCLLQLPADDGAFDGAFAVESLEHAVLPRQGVAELCRVVRPGGKVLIIDKHRDRQPFSEHEPWERWFTPEELAAWLGPYCNDVTIEPVSHQEGLGGNDLFLAASGTRRAVSPE